MTVREELDRERTTIICLKERWDKVKKQWDDIAMVASIILIAAMVGVVLLGCNALVELDQRIAWEDSR